MRPIGQLPLLLQFSPGNPLWPFGIGSTNIVTDSAGRARRAWTGPRPPPCPHPGDGAADEELEEAARAGQHRSSWCGCDFVGMPGQAPCALGWTWQQPTVGSSSSAQLGSGWAAMAAPMCVSGVPGSSCRAAGWFPLVWWPLGAHARAGAVPHAPQAGHIAALSLAAPAAGNAVGSWG